MKETVKRVRRMEALFDEAFSILKDLEKAADRYEASAETFRALAEYLSGDWRADYEADERGEIPPRVKRGVLSQDGLYDLLEKEKELKERLGL